MDPIRGLCPSGVAYAAKARGVKKNSDVGGWHYSPAGEERAVIARASIQPLYPEDTRTKKQWSRAVSIKYLLAPLAR